MVWLYGKQSPPEYQGANSDVESQITYNNQSKEKTLNQAAQFEEWHEGAGIITDDDNDVEKAPEDARFNTAVLETDPLGLEYPPRHKPGG